MAGFFAGVAKTPVSSLIMVSEMTTGYGLLTPLMLTTAVGYLLVPRRLSLYENQVESRVDSPAHEGEYMVDTLEGMFVRDAMPKGSPPTTILFDAQLPDILDAVADSRRHVFPVVDTQGELQGVILFDDIRLFFTERNLPRQAVVAQAKSRDRPSRRRSHVGIAEVSRDPAGGTCRCGAGEPTPRRRCPEPSRRSFHVSGPGATTKCLT